MNADGTFYGNEISFTTNATATYSLNGKWISGSLVILISGSNATFDTLSTNWEIARSKGYITIGGLKMKEITKINDTKWSCRDLWLKTTGGVIDGAIWSNDGTIIMSADGQSFTTTSTGPV